MKNRCINLIAIPILVLSGNMISSAESRDLVDPTRPLDYIAAPQQSRKIDLVLTSVVITGSIRSAVINGERVVENQLIGGAEVISIQPGRVILRKGELSQELKVHQSNVKRIIQKSSL